MPEEPTSTPNLSPTIDLNKKASSPNVVIPKKKLIWGSVALVVLILLAFVGSYFLGKAANNTKPELEKTTKVATKSATPANVVKGVMGEEVETSSGLSLTVESAAKDQAYEAQKDESRPYYATHSAEGVGYLDQSLLNVKVALRNKKTNPLSFYTSSFRLKDSEDNQYTTGFESGAKVVYGLNPGETTKITVSFQVPSNETQYKLIYDNAEIHFSIP